MVSKPDIDGLATLSVDELRHRWRELDGKVGPPAPKRLLVRELAWRMQRKILSGLDADTRRLLKAAIRAAPSESINPKRDVKKRKTRGPKTKLTTGAKLIRTWQGRDHEVTVFDNGKRFEYRGKSYRSLTEIAEKITGAHWSGPRFFGLDRLKGAA